MEKPVIVAYDFDGTITRKDTLLEFILFSKGRGKFYAGLALFSPLLIIMKLGLYPNWKAKQMLFSYFYKGTPIQQFDEWGSAFQAIINKRLRTQAIQSFLRHKKSGHTVIIVTASIENWVAPWAKEMNADMVLATQIETDSEGKITGRFRTKNCYGQEKVNRLLEQFPDRESYILIAYGDSRGDRELIEMADEGVYEGFRD
jgi:HAD superfamily hydrolase (TIGR01490 family)